MRAICVTDTAKARATPSLPSVAELTLRAGRTEREDLIIGAEICAPAPRSTLTAKPALDALETMLALDVRLLSPDGGRESLQAGLLQEALGDAPDFDVVDRGRMLLEQPIKETKPLLDRKLGA